MSEKNRPETDEVPIEDWAPVPGEKPRVSGQPATREGRVLTVGGRRYEVISRYRDAAGQVWCIVKQPFFPDRRPGAKPPPKGAYLERHIPDPNARQPRTGGQERVQLQLDDGPTKEATQ